MSASPVESTSSTAANVEPLETGIARRRRLLILVCLLAITLLGTWLQWRAYADTRDAEATALAQLAQMRADAAAIESLARQPRQAANRARANQELLAQVEQALQAVGVASDAWRDSVPLPPVRLAGSDYRRYATRIYLEGVSLEQLAALAYQLHIEDPQLSIGAIDLARRSADDDLVNVDLELTYLVYAPFK